MVEGADEVLQLGCVASIMEPDDAFPARRDGLIMVAEGAEIQRALALPFARQFSSNLNKTTADQTFEIEIPFASASDV